MSFLDTLATPVAFVLESIHSGLSTFMPPESGWTWSLSVVLLTVVVRILIFPLFVKQVKSQRRMQEIAPKMKELQAKHKGDKESLHPELMKLYKEHGTNPVSGCLPLLLQMPVFFAMFRVMNEIKPNQAGEFQPKFGLSAELIEHAARAEFVGAPIASAFNSTGPFLELLSANSLTVKLVTTAMIVTMGLTTYLTTRQMMSRNGPVTDPQQAQIQKLMLYVLPLSFAVFGFTFPVGLLLYQLVTNFWSMGQQHYIIRRMPVIQPGGAAKTGTKTPPKSAGKASGQAAIPAQQAGGSTTLLASDDQLTGDAASKPGQQKPAAKGPQSRAQAGSRKNKNKKRKRR